MYMGSVQFSSVTQSCLTLCDPMNRSTPGLPVHGLDTLIKKKKHGQISTLTIAVQHCPEFLARAARYKNEMYIPFVSPWLPWFSLHNCAIVHFFFFFWMKVFLDKHDKVLVSPPFWNFINCVWFLILIKNGLYSLELLSSAVLENVMNTDVGKFERCASSPS